jgi:Leucine-rich repeat (LRR) protein
MFVRWFSRSAFVALMVVLSAGVGCPGPRSDSSTSDRTTGPAGGTASAPGKTAEKAAEPTRVSTADAAAVEAAKKLLDGAGPNAEYSLLPGGVLTSIVIRDGAVLSAENFSLIGKLADLETLQIFNCRLLNDEMAAQLAGLKNLKSLAITNSVINDPTVEMIAKSFPNLTDLDLSSNTNITNSTMKIICGLKKLQRLTLIQDRFNDLGTSHLSKLEDLRSLDLRGNMEAADMTMEIVGALPKLAALKHRSTAVTDYGVENLARSKTLDSLLMQDFAVTGQAGQHVAKLPALTQLEVFRCQGFDSDGVLALKGMKLSRLTLRDLPAVDDRAMDVLADLPALKRLYLHELSSISDAGFQKLSTLKSLEVLDIWAAPQMTDATVAVIAGLPSLKELSLRTTDITDAAVDELLKMSNLQSLTLKDNGKLTPAGLEKLNQRKWTKLDTGATPATGTESP